MHLNLLYGIDWLCSHIWGVLREIGGVAIVTGLCTLIAYRMNTHYEKKIEAKYNGEIETLKSQLDIMAHAKNIYFDTEFSIYQELCSAFLKWLARYTGCFLPAWIVLPQPETGLKYARSDTGLLKKSIMSPLQFSEAKRHLFEEEKYNLFYSILTLSAKQIHKYAFSEPKSNHCSESVNKIREDGHKQTENIDKQWNELLNQLRAHFREMRSKESNNS